MRHHLAIAALIHSTASKKSLLKILEPDRYQVDCFENPDQFLESIGHQQNELDCIILQELPQLEAVIKTLKDSGVVLPAVIWLSGLENSSSKPWIYHAAEVSLSERSNVAIRHAIDRAIGNFLYLAPTGPSSTTQNLQGANPSSSATNLLDQQYRLSEKLKARLGYLGVYYKREPKFFLRHLPPEEQQVLTRKLRSEYREIVLAYFSEDGTVNARIDRFVEQAFFADMAVAQVVEIHMELMDAMATQLKLEGRSEEILLDYRLTLIDIIAHLCEMYRRSIPREE
ncbi:MAG: circadian clock protein KaiA [Oscillatoriales cyanobacterium]|nr:MAG: circadian clock protein KaiA [Oscillatoriales cyanobacterium]